MVDELLSLNTSIEKIQSGITINKPILDLRLRFNGVNEDFTEAYYWHMNFPYYVGKGYTPLKLEDHHHFSEASQYGANMRQIKGGSIRAFQENFQQLITLIRQHLLPLLKEVKEAHFYKEWFDKISDNDVRLAQELKKSSPDPEKLKKYRGERNEALNHMKDKWVNEVDGGRLWQMNRSASEQGLDFALLPQLFFGTNLDDPLQRKKTLKEQLDEDIYEIDISVGAKEQVARFMYKFYTWLPTAIQDTNVTFKLKISALRNIYAQIQMYINFMKPLLKEISRKTEGFHTDDFYRDFNSEHPGFVNLFDTSYAFIKILGIRGFERAGLQIADLEFTRFGLYIGKNEIIQGKYKGQSGFIGGEIPMPEDFNKDRPDKVYNPKYLFYPTKDRKISDEDFKKIKAVELYKNDVRTFPIIENDFLQRRRMENLNTPQGIQQVPYMKNQIQYNATAWNIIEIAAYREKRKEDDMKLMETFISELSVVREDLLKYLNYFSAEDLGEKKHNDMNEIVKRESGNDDNDEKYKLAKDLIQGPFKALKDMTEVLIPEEIRRDKKKGGSSVGSLDDSIHVKPKVNALEDAWKIYYIFKKTHGFAHF